MSCNVEKKCLVDGFFVAYKMVKKWCIYLKPFFTGLPTSHTYTWTHAHTDVQTIGKGKNARFAFHLKMKSDLARVWRCPAH